MADMLSLLKTLGLQPNPDTFDVLDAQDPDGAVYRFRAGQPYDTTRFKRVAPGFRETERQRDRWNTGGPGAFLKDQGQALGSLALRLGLPAVGSVAGPVGTAAGAAAGETLAQVVGGEAPSWGRTALAGGLAAAPGAVVQGGSFLKNLGGRTRPSRVRATNEAAAAAFTAKEAERAATHEAAQTAMTRQTAQAEQGRKALYGQQVDTERAVHRGMQGIGEYGESVQRQGLKTRAQELSRPTGAYKAVYADADPAVAAAAPLVDMPHTQTVIKELQIALKDTAAERPIMAELLGATERAPSTVLGPAGAPVGTTAAGMDLRRVEQVLQDLWRLKTPAARRLRGALKTDLEATPEGATLLAAMEGYKQDLGRTAWQEMVGKAGPVEAPLDVKALAKLFQAKEGFLGARLPESELRALRALVADAQRARPFEATPFRPSQSYRPESPFAMGKHEKGAPPVPREVEGPAAPGVLQSALLRHFVFYGGGAGMGAAASGNPKAMLLAGLGPLVESLPPLARAYRATLPPLGRRLAHGAAGVGLSQALADRD